MNATSTPTRCLTCGEALAFADWSRGADRCVLCVRAARQPRSPDAQTPSTTDRFERSSATARRSTHAARTDHVAHTEMLDEIPEELLDELTAALEAEIAARSKRSPVPGSAVREVIEEIGFGRSPAELSWAGWGFAAGFAANVALAKYAQMSAGASISEFFGPIVIGGVAAGLACAAIGWGLAKLRAA